MTRRVLLLLFAVLLLGGVGTTAVLNASANAGQREHQQAGGPAVRNGNLTLRPPSGRELVFRNMTWGPYRDDLVTVPADRPDAPRTASGVKCLRFYAASGTGVCLQAEHGTLGDSYQAVILDAGLRELHRFPLAGIPTRARVSPDGRLAAWTVFVGGDSYAGTNFSTRTSIVDTRTWKLDDNLETFTIIKDGHPYRASDINVWGVTFADDDRFYATVATGGQTYLVQGSLSARTLTTLHQNVECPSLSPDGTRIAYKKRVPGASPDAPWRLYVLDLRTMTETATAEHRNIDDQAVWSDDSTLVYALPGNYGTDLWTVPADGTGAARLLTKAALAPAYLQAN
ncbi:hypothetical protein P3T37_000913 [Kitasatospora sp. MAA4]|uniref:TolB family protein n=1 Tax=Kitasatospora sp. MAA4 TaxID=3035093 RepID=UPI0024758D90|nr:TolB-like translocation protein [Kitasatospora sp. MAA4]MDH6131544.1 hypothetical protein [Kitasatospora sp. MAA4]